MSQFLEESGDIDAILDEIGVSITHGSTTVNCLTNTPEEIGLDAQSLGGIIGRKIVVTLKTGALPDVVVGSLVVIDGVNHYVRVPLESDDPALTTYLCSRNAPAAGPDEETPTSWIGNDAPLLLWEAAAGLTNERIFGLDPDHADGLIWDVSQAGLALLGLDLDFLDARYEPFGGGGGGGVTDHGALTGLDDDDHPQYALAASLGTLATQNGTFSGTHSGTSSGTNTGDQDLSGYSLTSHAHTFASLTSTPTTLAGYGITDAQAYSAELAALAAITGAAYGRGFIGLADASAGRTYLGLGTLATQSGTFSGTSSGTNTGDETAARIRALGFFDVTNDGHTSGFDADTLDTYHASEFVLDADLVATSAGAGDAGKPIKLNTSGLLDESMLPALAITDVFVVASEAAMLALDAERGDLAIRSDLNKTFALSTDSPGTLADWKEMLTPTDLVLSVAGRTGNVTLAVADISGISAFGATLVDDADAASARSTLGLVIGTNVQAQDAGLTSFAALPTAADRYAYSTAADTWAEGTITAAARSILDDATVDAILTTLGGAAYTGSGGVVRANTPTLVTPVLGVATGTSLDLSGGAGSFALAVGRSAWFGGSFTGARIRQNVSNELQFSVSATDVWKITAAGHFVTNGAFTLGTITQGIPSLFLDEAGGGTQTAQVLAPTLASDIVVTTPASTCTLPGTVAEANLTVQAAALTASALYTPPSAGPYRVTFMATLTQAATSSSTLTGASGVVLNYTTGDGATARTQVVPMWTVTGAGTIAGSGSNTVGTTLVGHVDVYSSTTAMTFDCGYTSSGATPMQYAIRVRVERIN